MTKALLAFLVSFSAVASDCYIREVDLVTNEVTLAKEICINDIKLDLEVFGNSKATINYALDGESKAKEVKLNNPIVRRADGRIVFFVWDLQSEFAGGWCGDSVESKIEATLSMNKDGSDAKLEEIKGSVSTSNDNCHSDMREVQSFPYVLK